VTYVRNPGDQQFNLTMTAEECLAKAVEAEDMARLVALRTDKERLRSLAEKWRIQAGSAEEMNSGDSPRSWLRGPLKH